MQKGLLLFSALNGNLRSGRHFLIVEYVSHALLYTAKYSSVNTIVNALAFGRARTHPSRNAQLPRGSSGACNGRLSSGRDMPAAHPAKRQGRCVGRRQGVTSVTGAVGIRQSGCKGQ